MPRFTFDKKSWEKNRPSSAKASGVAKGIKAVQTDCPDVKSIKSEQGFQKARQAVEQLDEAFDTAKGKIKPKDDKHGVLRMIIGWKKELADYKADLAEAEAAAQLAEAQQATENAYQQMLADINVMIEEAKKLQVQLEADIRARRVGKHSDIDRAQQNYRNMIRDASKYATKAGLLDKMKFDPTVHKKVDPKLLTLPASAKLIKTRCDLLDEEADKITSLMEQAYDAIDVPDNSEYAGEVKKIVAATKKVRDLHKRQAGEAKKVAGIAKRVAELFKGFRGTDTAPLIQAMSKLIEAYNKIDEESLSTQYEVRNSSGKIQSRVSQLTKNDDFPIELNDRLRDQRTLVFDAYRPISVALGQTKNQINRMLKVLLAMEGTTASQAAKLQSDFEATQKDISSRYGR